MDIQDEVLKYLLQQLVYVDDLHHGVLPQEVQDIQNRTFPHLPLAAMGEVCEYKLCCPRADSHTAGQAGTAGGTDTPMLAPLPAELLTATRHLLHTKFGQELAHLVILRGARVAHAFAKANLPTKAIITSLAGSICPLMIQEAVNSYTQSLHDLEVPTFEQLARLPVPAGSRRSDPPQVPALGEGRYSGRHPPPARGGRHHRHI